MQGGRGNRRLELPTQEEGFPRPMRPQGPCGRMASDGAVRGEGADSGNGIIHPKGEGRRVRYSGTYWLSTDHRDTKSVYTGAS